MLIQMKTAKFAKFTMVSAMFGGATTALAGERADIVNTPATSLPSEKIQEGVAFLYQDGNFVFSPVGK